MKNSVLLICDGMFQESEQLKKEFNHINVYFVATGTTIASEIFLLPEVAFAKAGAALVLSCLIAALLVIPAVFSMTELATAMPRARGI